jgi:molybdenum cofactor cytidylyltransferase
MLTDNGIWSVILAAGESKRMGFPKMLLSFNGKTMIENVIENVAGSDSGGTLVVLGANKRDLIEIVRKCNVKYCFNENYTEGMLSSLKCGLKNLPSDLKAVLVFQGDQPFIGSSVINNIIGAYKSSDKGLVMPVHNGKRGHPLLIDRKYLVEIEKIEINEGLRSLAGSFPEDVLEIETDDQGILIDFDTFEDYKKEISKKQ